MWLCPWFVAVVVVVVVVEGGIRGREVEEEELGVGGV